MDTKATHEYCKGNLQCKAWATISGVPVADDRPYRQHGENQKEESNYLIPQDMDGPNDPGQHMAYQTFSLRKHAGTISVAKAAY